MMQYSLAVISDRLQALTRRLDSTPGEPGRLRLFSDPRPPVGGDPAGSAVELAVLVFPQPSLDTMAGYVLVLRNPVTTLVRATGEATWGRLENGNGDFVADGDVGLVDADNNVLIPNGDFIIRGTSRMLYAGGEFTITMARHREA